MPERRHEDKGVEGETMDAALRSLSSWLNDVLKSVDKKIKDWEKLKLFPGKDLKNSSTTKKLQAMGRAGALRKFQERGAVEVVPVADLFFAEARFTMYKMQRDAVREALTAASTLRTALSLHPKPALEPAVAAAMEALLRALRLVVGIHGLSVVRDSDLQTASHASDG